VFGHDQQVHVVARDVHRDDRTLLADIHASHAGGVATHGADIDSAKPTVRPAREAMITSSPGSTARTASSSSSSRMLIAMMPSALIGVLYASSSVFLTVPSRVANTRYSASEKSRVDTTAWMRSPSRSGRMLT